MARAVFLCLVLLSCAGCMISEQLGQGNEELLFHFDTQFNRIVLFARSAAIGLIALWLFAGSRKNAGPIVFGIALALIALGLFAKDYPRMNRYRVEVLDDGLVLAIPPDEEKSFAWGAIEEIYVEGLGTTNAPPKDAVAKMLELPEWHSMRITVAGAGEHQVDLKLLSLEQRQTLWRAIARRAHLVEISE
jgi:hypothetical protein